MATTITLDQAKQRLLVTHAEADDVIAEIMDGAEAMVFGYLRFGTATPTPFEPAPPWTIATVPADVREVILATVVLLDRWRGDEPLGAETDAQARTWPPPRLKAVLDRYRDPVYA